MEPMTPQDQNYGPNDGSMDSSPPELDAQSKAKNLRLFQRGLTWMAVGVGIMGLSFMIQFLLFQSDDRSFIVPMYVLTTLGSLCVMKGLVDAFGFWRIVDSLKSTHLF